MKLWNLYTTEFYSGVNKKIIKFVDKYMELEDYIKILASHVLTYTWIIILNL